MPRRRSWPRAGVSDLAAGLAAARTAIDDGRATGLLARLRAERIAADATRAAAPSGPPRDPARRRRRPTGRDLADRRSTGVTVATRPRSTTRATPSRGPAGGVVAEIAARRIADLEPELAAVGRARARPGGRRGAAATRPRRTARPARPAPHRRGQAALAVGRRRSPGPTRTPSPGRGPTSAAARARSRSCASRTGSAARSTTWPRSARPSACRSWPRSSSSTPRQLPAPPGGRAPTRSCCSPCSTRPAA